MVDKVRLPRLPVNWKEQPQLFERYWDEAMSRLEAALNEILKLPDIQEAIDAANAAAASATTAAAVAQDAADNAQTSADGNASETALINSYISNFTPPLLSVTATGVVTIANHDRVYGDGSTAAVSGATVSTAATPGQVVRLFYDDVSRAGGTVTYQWTVDPSPPPVQLNNRHSVGVVTVPASASAIGKSIQPPGYVEEL